MVDNKNTTRREGGFEETMRTTIRCKWEQKVMDNRQEGINHMSIDEIMKELLPIVAAIATALYVGAIVQRAVLKEVDSTVVCRKDRP